MEILNGFNSSGFYNAAYGASRSGKALLCTVGNISVFAALSYGGFNFSANNASSRFLDTFFLSRFRHSPCFIRKGGGFGRF